MERVLKNVSQLMTVCVRPQTTLCGLQKFLTNFTVSPVIRQTRRQKYSSEPEDIDLLIHMMQNTSR